jgi:hypothetical protein
MRHFKAFRALSFLSAVGFLIQYLGTIGAWAYFGNNPPDWFDPEHIDLAVVMTILFLGYNWIFDCLAAPASIAIVVKELSMEMI